MDCSNPRQLFFEQPFDRFSDQEFISKENKLILNFTKPYRKLLKSKGILPIRFHTLFKKFTKKKNVPKNSIYYGIFNIADYFELLYYLYSSIGCVQIVKCRCISERASYDDKDIVLTFFAIEFPYLMLEVPKDNFSKFTFCRKIYRKDELTVEWNACIFNVHNQIPIRALNLSNSQQEESGEPEIPEEESGEPETLEEESGEPEIPEEESGEPETSEEESGEPEIPGEEPEEPGEPDEYLYQQDPQPENPMLISSDNYVSFNYDTNSENYDNQLPAPSSPTDMSYAYMEIGSSTVVDNELFPDESNDHQYSFTDEFDISDANDFGPAFEYSI